MIINKWSQKLLDVFETLFLGPMFCSSLISCSSQETYCSPNKKELKLLFSIGQKIELSILRIECRKLSTMGDHTSGPSLLNCTEYWEWTRGEIHSQKGMEHEKQTSMGSVFLWRSNARVIRSFNIGDEDRQSIIWCFRHRLLLSFRNRVAYYITATYELQISYYISRSNWGGWLSCWGPRNFFMNLGI